jgi:plastocyanin
VGWRSSVLMIILIFSVMLSLLYIATLVARAPHEEIPSKPKVSQIQALEIALNEAKRHEPETTDILLYFPFYNFSRADFDSCIEQCYRGYDWSLVEHIRQNPEQLQLPLYYFHANGTKYSVSSDDGSHTPNIGFMPRYCFTDDAGERCSITLYHSLVDRLVYGLDIAILPSGVPMPMLIDAETGEVAWNSENRLPMPRVDIYDNITEARTIRELQEAMLNPPETGAVQIVEGASNQEQETNFLPKEARGVIEISSKVQWINHDSVAHTVTSDNGYSNRYTGKFDSGIIEPFESYEYAFSDVGDHPYHCEIHPWMKGEVEIIENFT